MMKKIILLCLGIFLFGCTAKPEFEVSDEVHFHPLTKYDYVMDEYLLEHPETLNFLETEENLYRLSVYLCVNAEGNNDYRVKTVDFSTLDDYLNDYLYEPPSELVTTFLCDLPSAANQSISGADYILILEDNEKETLIEGLKEITFIIDIVDGEHGLTAKQISLSNFVD